MNPAPIRQNRLSVMGRPAQIGPRGRRSLRNIARCADSREWS